MMRQRFNLFYAGFTASLPGLYFGKQKLKESITSPVDTEMQIILSRYFTSFEDDKDEQLSHLQSALGLAKQFDMDDFNTPHTSLEYFDWLEDFINEFESRFPMGRIEHYYFLYARRIAELLQNMGLIKTYVDLQLLSNQSLDLVGKIENTIKDSEYIVFKLMAPAALLSSEPRQSCFNGLYSQMCEEIKVFKNLDLTNFTEEQFLKLKSNADNFQIVLMNGFKKCVGVLKEL